MTYPLQIAPLGRLFALRSGAAILAIGELAELRHAQAALALPPPSNVVRFAARPTLPSHLPPNRKAL